MPSGGFDGVGLNGHCFERELPVKALVCSPPEVLLSALTWFQSIEENLYYDDLVEYDFEWNKK